MPKDRRSIITIAELKEKKNVLESNINEMLLNFESDTGMPVVDIDVEIHYPPESDNDGKFTRSIDICIAL